MQSSEKKPGLLNRILRGDQLDFPTNAHSILLANQQFIYEYQGIFKKKLKKNLFNFFFHLISNLSS